MGISCNSFLFYFHKGECSIISGENEFYDKGFLLWFSNFLSNFGGQEFTQIF